MSQKQQLTPLQWGIKFGVLGIGTSLAALGIICLLQSGYGTDTLSVFLTGVQQHVPLSFGHLCILFNMLVLLFLVVAQRSLIGVGTVISGFCVGALVDWWRPGVLQVVAHVPAWGLCLLGVMLYSLGIALYVASRLGSSALESLSFYVQNKSGQSLRKVRIFLDGIFILSGFLLGSREIQVGTVLCLVITGPLVQVVWEKTKTLIY